MTPDKLSEIEFRARNARDFPTINDAKDCLFIASAKGDVLDVCAALRTAWAEREEQRQSAFFATANARTMQAERDARPDAATVAEVVELLHSIEDGPMSNAAAKLLVQALRLLEKP